MTVLAFPLERRYEPGDRVRFHTEDGKRISGTVMEPRADRPGQVRVWADETGFWNVPPVCLERLNRDEVVVVQPPPNPMRRQLMRRVASLYRDLDQDRLIDHVNEGVEDGRYPNPRDGVDRRRRSLREKLSYYFRALGRPVSRDEALEGGM